ncbi:hypothetical protein BGZ68_010136, partial [Mortierella alpina]
MKVLRTRLASLLVVASAGSLALLQLASGLTDESEANTNPQIPGFYRRDNGAGHRKHHQHHHHHSHIDHHHKHHATEGKGKPDDPYHKVKGKHHKKPKVPTYEISLVCKTLVIGSIQCPIRPTDPELPPSCHTMNNGAAVVYINMQEPCFEDLSQMCSADESTNFFEDTIAATDAKPDHAFKELCVAVKAKRHHAFKDLCVAVGDFCGNELFGCNFVATTQYRCDSIGERPKPIAENSASCGSTKACLCPASSTGLICGGELPKECKAYKNSVYDCSGGAGTTPKLSGHCAPKERSRSSRHNALIQTAALYLGLLTTRASMAVSAEQRERFPKNSLIECSGPGAKPSNPQICEDGVCTVSNGDNICRDTRCTCPGTNPICGFDLPKRCNAKPNTIYYCPGGKGAEARILTECKPGTICNRKEAPIGAACGGRICECPGDKEVCSNAFPDSCALDKNAIYNCTSSGTPTKTKVCDIDEVCVMLPDGAVCNKKPCKCPTDGDICGSVFPEYCKIATGYIYSCIKGQAPIFKKGCAPGGCTATKDSLMAAAAEVFQGAVASDQCDPDPCKCRENGDVCGSTFPETCQFHKDTLYSCTGKDATPMEKMVCSTKGCVPTAGDDVCGSCLCPDGTPTCGSVFGPECKMDNSALYTCSSADALPSSSTKCPRGCDVRDGPDKCNNDCQCKDEDNVCGSVFPAEC